MNTNDQGLHDLKHHVMLEVCRMAWDDCLTHEERERVVKEMIPGPKPTLRCCIYKEREIIRGRIRLAMGIDPDVTRPSKNIVAVIPAACDDCPIQDHMVTDSCRFCLGRACLNACRFGAITPGDTKMKIDPNKCKSCGMCAQACPFHAIIHSKRPCQSSCPAGAISYDEYGLCTIDDEKCIHCGHCIHSCPFGAIGSKIFLVDIIKAIKEGKRVIAMAAPATEGQFGKDCNMATIRSALIAIVSSMAAYRIFMRLFDENRALAGGALTAFLVLSVFFQRAATPSGLVLMAGWTGNAAFASCLIPTVLLLLLALYEEPENIRLHILLFFAGLSAISFSPQAVFIFPLFLAAGIIPIAVRAKDLLYIFRIILWIVVPVTALVLCLILPVIPMA